MKTSAKFIGIIAVGALIGLALAGCTTMDTIGKDNQGVFQNITVPAKDFDSLGLVFTEVSFDTDAKGSRGDIFTYNALLKEAHKLGADTIVNLVIDVKKEGTNDWIKILGLSRDMGVVTGKETWYGSATAIKYTESLKNVDTTTITENATIVTSERAIGNGGSGNTAAVGTPVNPNGPSVRKWWNPFTWFKK
jgi:predicted small secreted protein